MADKPQAGESRPIYYGTVGGSSPVYYGSPQTPSYYGKSPYYGSGAYGSPYGGAPYYGGGGDSGGGDSLVGAITLARVLRVFAQRWISVVVFLLIGLVVSFAVYRVSPTVYEAKSEFSVDMRQRRSAGGVGMNAFVDPDYGANYEEVFNTRLSEWRGERIVNKIISQYHANFPASTVADSEIAAALQGSQLELQRHSRLITIAVRSGSPQLAAALANAYAAAIENFTDEDNRLRCDKAVSQIHDQVEKRRRADEKIMDELLKFRTENKVDNLRSEREILQQSLQKVTADVLQLETETTAAAEWVKVLEAAQEKPEDFGALPSAVPRSTEIGQAYTDLQKCRMEVNSLLTTFTKNHPQVRVKEKELENLRQQFAESVSRALSTAHGNLTSLKNQLATHQRNRDSLTDRLAATDRRIVFAESGLARLEGEKSISSELLKQLQQNENTARIEAEQNNEIVRVGNPASVPTKPVLPNPTIIFAAGAAAAFALGILFILVMDHLEDTVVSLADIESRLALKVLCVLPHVRRRKREDVARFIVENRYSQFAEAMAGLRNLLDSPRYRAMSQVLLLMSTQPGEGKTITSCALAASSAQTHRRTLLVDFDLRRPRLARVWGVTLDETTSFSHALSRGESNFAALIHPSGVPQLDLMVSLPPDGVDPASILGSKTVAEFFSWARSQYDRVVIDSPPYGLVGDVMTLAAMADSVMIMCCPDRTHFKPVQHAFRSLTEAGATVIGVVVNDVETGGLGGGASGGYGYGYRGYGGYMPGGYAPSGAAAADADGAEGEARRPGGKVDPSVVDEE